MPCFPGKQPEAPQNHPSKHHNARYYAHRVRESLTTRVSMAFCSCFLSFLLAVGVILFVLWLNLRPHRPRFHVESFSIPGISQESGFQNTAISFNVKDRNPNHDIGIYYDTMKGSVYFGEQLLGSTELLFPFYQGPKNTTWIQAHLDSVPLRADGATWKEIQTDRLGGKVVFRLDLKAKIRFQVTRWGSKRHRLYVSCAVAVGPDGEILDLSKHKRCSIYF